MWLSPLVPPCKIHTFIVVQAQLVAVQKVLSFYGLVGLSFGVIRHSHQLIFDQFSLFLSSRELQPLWYPLPKWQHVVKTRSKSAKMSCRSRRWNCPVSLWCGLKECWRSWDSTEFDLHTLSPRETAQFHRLLEHDIFDDFHHLLTTPHHLNKGPHGSCNCVQDKNKENSHFLKYLLRVDHIVLAIRSELIWKASLSSHAPCSSW